MYVHVHVVSESEESTGGGRVWDGGTIYDGFKRVVLPRVVPWRVDHRRLL